MTNQPVAAFDFDGTLAKGDSLSAFLVRLVGPHRFARAIARHALPLSLVGIGKADRDLTKERFIAYTLTGHSAEDVHSIGQTFAADLIGTRLFPLMRERLEWHRSEGHRLIMVSASLDVYLSPLAKELGFDELLCTKLEIVDNLVTGKLTGGNVRAAEKARQLSQLLPDNPERALWAYGNSSGDHEMLSMADHPFWVNRKGEFTPWRGRKKRPQLH